MFEGLERMPVDEAAGRRHRARSTASTRSASAPRIADLEHPDALPLLKVDEPTLTMNFLVNASPLAGREGKYVTSRQIRERLERETKSNVALRVEYPTDTDTFIVHGRGELHLTILLENMRREGYELAVSRPRVVYKEIDGVTLRAVRSADGGRRGRRTRARVMEELGAPARRAASTCSPTARAACASTTASRRAA